MRYWKIEGFDGLTKIYEEAVKSGLLSENQLKNLLKALTAKASLDYEEIVGAFVRKGSRRSNNLVLVAHHKPEPKFSCGENPFFTARIVTKN
jgi:hypothetical protein